MTASPKRLPSARREMRSISGSSPSKKRSRIAAWESHLPAATVPRTRSIAPSVQPLASRFVMKGEGGPMAYKLAIALLAASSVASCHEQPPPQNQTKIRVSSAEQRQPHELSAVNL